MRPLRFQEGVPVRLFEHPDIFRMKTLAMENDFGRVVRAGPDLHPDQCILIRLNDAGWAGAERPGEKGGKKAESDQTFQGQRGRWRKRTVFLEDQDGGDDHAQNSESNTPGPEKRFPVPGGDSILDEIHVLEPVKDSEILLVH